VSGIAVIAAGAWILFVAALVFLLVVEVVAGSRRRRPSVAREPRVPVYAVLMPAHDEARGIAATVAAVLRQLPPQGRLIVIADNCTDDTADEARAAGAEVIVRTDPVSRGKGHALAYGVAHLRQASPEAVLIVDADCVPSPGALDVLAARAVDLRRPTQGLYLMLTNAHAPMRIRMAAFAWAMHNELRPMGLHRLGLPCQMMGTGMALPWFCLERVSLASGHLVEDMQLGANLAAAGYAPQFCPDARVDSWFPEDGAGLDSQRKRWEHGHLSMILSAAPRTLWHGLRARNLGAVALALDMCIPPVALLALFVLLSCAVAAWTSSMGVPGRFVAAVALISALGFVAAVLLAWARVGRQWVRFPELVAAPFYVLRKLPVYASFLVKRQKEWIRTSRPP
jgi:cellulose synthase/poly-beta-1,6-N-acetylglucosamine synthase-like glycosyltransferase